MASAVNMRTRRIVSMSKRMDNYMRLFGFKFSRVSMDDTRVYKCKNQYAFISVAIQDRFLEPGFPIYEWLYCMVQLRLKELNLCRPSYIAPSIQMPTRMDALRNRLLWNGTIVTLPITEQSSGMN